MNIFYVTAVFMGLATSIICAVVGIAYLIHKYFCLCQQPPQHGPADYLEITEAKTKEK